jgi:hypothetical protein
MDNPVRDLLAQYQARREAVVKKTAGTYLDDRSSVLGAADSMLQRVAKARETLLAIKTDLERGTISAEQAPKLRKAVVDDVRSYIDRTAGATGKVLKVLPDRLLGDAFPLHHDRSPATAEAKADLDRELAGVKADDLPTALAATVRRRYAEGDRLGGDLLLSAHGRDRLASAGVPDAERVHASLRRDLASQVPPPPGDRGHAAATLGHVEDWTAAYTVGMNAADLMLRELEAGRYDPDA